MPIHRQLQRCLLLAFAAVAALAAALGARPAFAAAPIDENGCIPAAHGLYRCNWGPNPVYGLDGSRVGTLSAPKKIGNVRTGSNLIACQAHGRRKSDGPPDDESTNVWAWAKASDGNWGWTSELGGDWGMGAKGFSFPGFDNVRWCGDRHGPAPGDAGWPSRGSHPKPDPRPGPKPKPQPTIRYVALGDSYSSGEGAGEYEAGSNTSTDKCHRSARAFSQQLMLPGVQLQRYSFACSGATTADVLEKSLFGEPPQISHRQLHGAQLVTISVGGDDLGFSTLLSDCARPFISKHPQQCAAGTIDAKVSALKSRLTSTYKDVRAAAGPLAHIVVIGYPNLFPSEAHTCPWITALYNKPMREIVRSEGGHLAQVIAAAADAAEVQYVDVRSAFASHEICSPDPWIQHVEPNLPPLFQISASFHPTVAGQAGYAAALRKALSGVHWG